MSTMLIAIRRLLAAFAPTTLKTTDPEALSLHDWADLPVHHPLCDRAPC